MTARILRRNGNAPVEFVRRGRYRALCEFSRTVKVAPCADAGDAPRHCDRLASAPLRPSEGLPVASPRALKPCPAHRLRGPETTAHPAYKVLGIRDADGETKNMGPLMGQPWREPTRRQGTSRKARTTGGHEGHATERKETRVDSVPVTLDAERKVLGTLLVFYTRAALDAVEATGLKPADFYWRQHEAVYRSVLALHRADEWVDTLTVTRFLAAQPHDSTGGTWLEAVGGPARVEYLAAFADANAFMTCARIVAEDGRWRRWLNALHSAHDAIESRDEEGFWAAIGSVREDVLPRSLRVVEGEAA